MILGAAIFLSFIAILFLAYNPQIGLLVTLVFKPIIDASWQHTLLGFSVLQFVGAAVPIIVLAHMLFSKHDESYKMPLASIWLIYLFSGLVSVASMVAAGKSLPSFNFFLRIMNGFVGFYMFQYYFSDMPGFRRLLVAYLIAGLFPMLMGLYQTATGEVWRMRVATGGLIRHVGLYHDAVNFRHYAYMTITAILLYWAYFAKRTFFRNFLLTLYGAICTLVVFKVYSKAGYFILGLWIVTWTILNKKFGLLLVIILALIAFNFAFDNNLLEHVTLVFSKETSAIEGTGDPERIFSGRVIGWKTMWENWKSKDLLTKTFGAGTMAYGAHNDYLRVLISGGIFGLTAYVILLGAIGYHVLINLLRRLTPLNIMAAMIFSSWIVDTIGLVPGLYPSYQWYVWGFIGLALRGVEGLSEPAKGWPVNEIGVHGDRFYSI